LGGDHGQPVLAPPTLKLFIAIARLTATTLRLALKSFRLALETFRWALKTSKQHFRLGEEVVHDARQDNHSLRRR